jgi:hypothetical protein
MPDLNLGALTIPIFATIFGAGWTSCYVWIAKPLKERLDKLEAKHEALFTQFHEIAMKDR